MLPGDLVTFGRGKKGAVSHIGIYVGNGRIVHASTKAGEVIETDLLKPKVAGVKRWKGTRRVLSDDGLAVAAADSAS
jgi:cell wall-associated NlpC family hydrolase